MTHQAKYNATVNLRRKGISTVPLPPRHERAAPLIPVPRENANNAVVVPRNPALDLEAPRPREPSVSAFDRLWRSIVGLSLGWFEHEDGGYFILWYDLNEKFSEVRIPKDRPLSIRIEGPDGKVTLAAEPSMMWAEERTFYIRTDFSEKAARWFETNRAAVRVVLVRKAPAPTVSGKRPRREIAFVPTRAKHVPRFC